jgi:ABC-type branched-subunit amino acid transport system ATPase component
MSKPVLRAAGISKRFGGLLAVDRVDLALQPNEIHAVIGPNGAGKSTFLATLAGDLAPTVGRVFLADQDVTHTSVEGRTRLGVGRTYQRSAVIAGFSALDMVRLASLHGTTSTFGLLGSLRSNAQATKLAESALARVRLGERADVTTDVLSHGEKRRLEIAAVLALEPKILLLDEPLAGLGPDESRDVVALIESLKAHCAIMLIEHDIDTVFAISDHITVLDNGRVIGSGTPAAVRDDPVVQRAYLGVGED